jgi:hypothetical protein
MRKLVAGMLAELPFPIPARGIGCNSTGAFYSEFEVIRNVISNEAQRREKSLGPMLAKPTSSGFLVASAALLPSLLEACPERIEWMTQQRQSPN